MQATMERTTLTPVQAYARITGTQGKIFNCTFTKKDGTVRSLTGRLGVKQCVTGKGLAFKPLEYSLLPVFDIQLCSWRMVNIDALRSLTIAGVEYGINSI